MRKALLVLGGGSDQVFMIDTAKQMGVETVCVDGNPRAPGLKVAEYSRAIDFSDVEAVLSYCRELIKAGVNLVGVSTMGSDIPHIIAKIARAFNWPGPSEETAEWATHKLKMKRRFSANGIPVPRFAQVQTTKEINDLRQEWGANTVIIKPTDRAGSRGVRVINQNDDLQDALDYAYEFSLNHEIMVEEFIQGHQISTETVMYEGIGVTPGFADRVYRDTHNFLPAVMENGGWLPSDASPTLRAEICRLVESAARVLGVKNGVAKGDVVICPSRGPMIIEMAARLSGGDFSESLVPISSGVNYVRTALDIAMGLDDVDLSVLTPSEGACVANRYFFVRPGLLEDISGLDVIRDLNGLCKFELQYEIGDQLPKIDSHAQRTGVFVVKGVDRCSVQKGIDYIYENVKFKVGGTWVTGHPREYPRFG